MAPSLPQVAQEHHERILAEVDRWPEMADALLTASAEDIRSSVIATSDFLRGELLPHVDAVERSVHPELERMFQNGHSMRPLRLEHDEIRRLAGEYERVSADLREGRVTLGRTLAMRRVVFGLYALLKVHLAEEEAYLRIVERGGGSDVSEVIAAALDHPVVS
jgi:hypothetical protein